MVKKILTWAALAFLVFFVAFRPDSAAQVFKSMGAAIIAIAQGFGDFFTSILS